MDCNEALSLLDSALHTYRDLSYAEVAAKIDSNTVLQVTGPSGVEYQIEIQVFWDGKPQSDIRILGSIDDGTFRAALRPVCRDFIVKEDQ
jgi:hypothetical protein